MSEVTVTLDDGREIKLTLSEGGQIQQQRSMLPPAMAEQARLSAIEERGVPAAAMQGLTFGFADELAGAISGPEAQARMRQDVARFREESPVKAGVLEMSSAILPGIGLASGLGRMAQMTGRAGQIGRSLSRPAMLPQAAIGGAEGALYGAGVGETPGERLRGGITGTGLGAVGGGLTAPLVGALTRRMAPGMEAERLVGSTIQQDLGRAPGATDFAEMQLRAQQQPQRTLAEIAGPTTEDLARTSARVPTGGARALATEVLESRRQGATDRLMETLRKSTGAREDYWKNIRNLEAKAKREAKPLYDAARSAPFAADQDLLELAGRGVDTGEIRAGYEAARRQARLREGKEIPTWRDLTGEDGPGLENLDMETWDWIKRGLDARYKKVVRQDPALAAAIWDYRQQVVSKLDEIVPEYREARARYAGPMEQRDAQQAGRAIFKEDAEYTEDFIRELSQGEKDAYITGAVQAIKDKLKSVPIEGGMPRFTQLSFDRLRNAFPSDETAENFLQSVLGERDMQRFRNMILGGSPTADILASQAQQARTMGAARGIGQMLTGEIGQGARQLAASVAPSPGGALPERVNAPLARMLFSQGPQVQAALQRLQTPPMAPRLMGPTAATVGGVGGAQLVPRPIPGPEDELEELKRSLPPGYEIIGVTP